MPVALFLYIFKQTKNKQQLPLLAPAACRGPLCSSAALLLGTGDTPLLWVSLLVSLEARLWSFVVRDRLSALSRGRIRCGPLPRRLASLSRLRRPCPARVALCRLGAPARRCLPLALRRMFRVPVCPCLVLAALPLLLIFLGAACPGPPPPSCPPCCRCLRTLLPGWVTAVPLRLIVPAARALCLTTLGARRVVAVISLRSLGLGLVRPTCPRSSCGLTASRPRVSSLGLRPAVL